MRSNVSAVQPRSLVLGIMSSLGTAGATADPALVRELIAEAGLPEPGAARTFKFPMSVEPRALKLTPVDGEYRASVVPATVESPDERWVFATRKGFLEVDADDPLVASEEASTRVAAARETLPYRASRTG